MQKNSDSIDKRIKTVLRYLKLNENIISTVMGLMVILFAGALIFNYVKTANWNSWKELTKIENEIDSAKLTEEKVAEYTVQKGDHLWKISEKVYGSGYNYVDIIEENKLNSTTLVEGQKLKLPQIEAKESTTEEKVLLSTNTDEPKESKIAGVTTDLRYTTVRGDSLWKIAVEKLSDGYRWTEIYALNKHIFANPKLIHAGVEIKLPETK